MFATFSSIRSRLRIPLKLRNGRLKSMFDYVEQVADDYYHVARDVVQDCKDRPLRASVIASLIAGSVVAFKTNPTLEDYYDQLILGQNEMSLVDPCVRNSDSYEYLFNQWQMTSGGNIRRLNLLFFSILWRADYPQKSGLYAANCKYLQPKYSSYLLERIIDVGIFNNWFKLAEALKDFDVNPQEEFKV